MALGALAGISAGLGIANSLVGQDEARDRQRALQRAHSRYGQQRQAVFNQAAQDYGELASAMDQSRLALQEALNSADRQRAAEAQQQVTAAAMQQALMENVLPQAQSRSGTAGQRSQQAAQSQAQDSTALQAAIFGERAAGMGRQGFDLGAQGQFLESVLPMQQQGQDVQTMAALDDLRNQAAMQGAVNRAQAQGPSFLSQALGLGSALAGAGSMIAGGMQGPQAGPQGGTLPTINGVTGPWR